MRARLCGTTNRSVMLSVRTVRADAGFRTVRHVRFGSSADIGVCPHDVRFTPESGHQRLTPSCPLWANRQHHALRVAYQSGATVNPGSYTSRVAHRLSDFRRLRHSSDFCACNNLSSACAGVRHHAFVRGSLGGGISDEVRGSMQRESLSSRFNMFGPSCQVVKTPELLVHPLQRFEI